MENLVPSAEEHLRKFSLEEYDEGGYLGLNEREIKNMLIEFAKMHVEQALEMAAIKATTEDIGNPGPDGWDEYIIVDQDSVRNAYPLDNIK